MSNPIPIPIPLTEADAREFAQRIATKSVAGFKRNNFNGVASVTVTVRLSNGREISAEAKNE
jgi:hypothetical protein